MVLTLIIMILVEVSVIDESLIKALFYNNCYILDIIGVSLTENQSIVEMVWNKPHVCHHEKRFEMITI